MTVRYLAASLSLFDFSLIQNELNSIGDLCEKLQMQILLEKRQGLTLIGGYDDGMYRVFSLAVINSTNQFSPFKL